jgi:hypothetical protein
METIRSRAELQQKTCTFEIPVWMPGFACYDSDKIANMIKRILLTLDYHVTIHDITAHNNIVQKKLTISWKHASYTLSETPQQHSLQVPQKGRKVKRESRNHCAKRDKKTVVVLS